MDLQKEFNELKKKSELNKFKYKKMGPVIGKFTGFRKPHRKGIEDLEHYLSEIVLSIGSENIESIFLYGGAIRKAKMEEDRRATSDFDLKVIMKKGIDAEKLLSKKDHNGTELRFSICAPAEFTTEKEIKKIDNKLSIIEGFPIYDAEKGHKIQERMANKLIKEQGEEKLIKTTKEWQARLRERGKYKSRPKSTAFLTPYFIKNKRRGK